MTEPARFFPRLNTGTSPSEGDGIVYQDDLNLWRPAPIVALIGQGSRTSDQNTISTITDITSCTVTTETFDEAHTIFIIAHANFTVGAGGIITFSIRESTTVLQQGIQTATGLSSQQMSLSLVLLATAAAHTYKLSVAISADVVAVEAGTDHPTQISVFDCGVF